MSTRTRLVTAVVLLILAAVGIVVLGNVVQKHTTNNEAFEAVTRVDIQLETGTLQLVEATGTAVHVERKSTFILGEPETKQSLDGDALVIRQKCGLHLGSCRTEYVIAVPSTVNVVARTGNGAVEATRVKGALELTTTSGDVTLTNTFGRVQATTTNGSVNATDLSSADVITRTTGGNTSLAFSVSPNSVNSESRNGDITVIVPQQSSPFNVTADSANGKVTKDVRTDPQSPRTIRVYTENGDVRVARAPRRSA